MTLYWDCDKQGCYKDRLPDWGFLDRAFQEATGRNIRCTDIDGHAEINGQHLIIEAKDRVDIPIHDAQRESILQFWAQGYCLVILLWGRSSPYSVEVYWPSGRKQTLRRWQAKKVKPDVIGEKTEAWLSDLAYRWAIWAEKTPCPFQYDAT